MGFLWPVCKWKSCGASEQMEVKRWRRVGRGRAALAFGGGCTERRQIPPRERQLRRKICGEINGCYWGGLQWLRRLYYSCLFFCSQRTAATPLIDNLVSCNEARTRPPRPLFFLPFFPLRRPQCQRLLGSVRRHLQSARGRLMWLTEAEEANPLPINNRSLLCFHLLVLSAGHQDSSSPQPCSVGGGSCPAMCTCSNNIVDCRGKGLTAIPANLPDSMAEM